MMRSKQNKLYAYEGLTSKGELIKGQIKAPDLSLAQALLYQQGILTEKLFKKRTLIGSTAAQKIKRYDILLMTRQLANLLKTGISLPQSFDMLAQSQNKPQVKHLLLEIKNDIEAGLTFTEALKKQANYFTPLFCALVEVGEKSATLEIILEQLANDLEKKEKIRKKIKSILLYPCSILVMALLISLALILFVIPRFEALFQSFSAELPLMTQALIQCSHFFIHYWPLLSLSIALVAYSICYARRQSKGFSQWLDQGVLKLPWLGSVLEKTVLVRFTQTLSISLSAGLPLPDALQLIQSATGYSLYIDAVQSLRQAITAGQSLQVAMQQQPFFPPLLVQMTGVGETCGNLEKMLAKVADFYEDELEQDFQSLQGLLEPLIMAILGLFIGGLIVAMYLPVFNLGSVV